MRVLVCGGRDFGDLEGLYATLDKLHQQCPITVLIHGGACGADSLAGCWAMKNKIMVEVFRANWNVHGKAAGTIRNERMLKRGRPALVLAFPGGRGTADMVARAKKAKVPTLLAHPYHG